jgi:hypothetical protein
MNRDRKRPGRTAVLPRGIPGGHLLTTISDARWGRLRRHIPGQLSPDAETRLRQAILKCCDRYRTALSTFQTGTATADALRSPGKRQLSHFEKLSKGLRAAADAWKQIGPVHDDLLTDFGVFQKWAGDLDAMATEAERRLAGLQQLGDAKPIAPPWRSFVLQVAACLRVAGFDPISTGRAYEGGVKLTWFQELLWALNIDVLGRLGRPSNSREAFAADVARVLRGGDTRPGKPASKSPDRE